MKALVHGIRSIAGRLPLPLILILIVGLNVYWTLTLNAMGAHFEQIAGAPLLDLQNVRGVLSPEAATALISSYSPEARSFYWVFFILDNLMPPIVFGSFALLWAYLLVRLPARWGERLLCSPLLLVPFGVGLFDCLENLCFVLAMSSAPELIETGLLFVNLKALCLFATFGITPLLILLAVATRLRRAQTLLHSLAS